jgi:hypothetical protein
MLQSSSTSKSIVRQTPLLLVPVILAFIAINPQIAAAQKGAKATTITGKLVSVTKKGRTAVLTVETADKETKEFQITARTKLAVTAKGDTGFLTKGQFVSAMPVATNMKLFGKNFTVHIGPGKKQGVFTKAARKPGVSTSAWNIAGQIIGRTTDKDYPDYEVITLRIGRRTVPVFLDKGYTVTVLFADVSLAEPGSNVTIEGRPGTRNRFMVSSVKVELSKPLKAEEFFAADKSPKKKRGRTKTTKDK